MRKLTRVMQEWLKKGERKNRIELYLPAVGICNQPNPARIDMCGGWRRGRAARVPPRNKHRMHERGSDSTISRWRWSFTGISGGQAAGGTKEQGMDGWASCELSGAGRLVRLYPRERECGRWGGRDGNDGSVVVLAWCYPYPLGKWWDGVIDMPCRRQCHTPRHAHVHSASVTTQGGDGYRGCDCFGWRTWSVGVLCDLSVFTLHKIF